MKSEIHLDNFIFGEAVGKWVCEKTGGEWSHLCRAIGLKKHGRIVAGILYDGYTCANIHAQWRCDEPKLINRDFYFLAFDYPFNQLKVKRVTAIVNSTNLHSQAINEKLGFERETTLCDYFPSGDGIVYVMRPQHCRFIRGRYGKRKFNSAST